MKLSTQTLKNIAVTAGISATIVGSASAASIAPQEKEPQHDEPHCVFPEAPNQTKQINKKTEYKTVKDFFIKADSNKDGKLSAEEFNRAYVAIVAQEKAKARAKAAQAKHPVPPIGIDNCPGCGLG